MQVKSDRRPPNTLDVMVNACGAVQRGIDDGKDNLPSVAATTPGESEAAIRHRFLVWWDATLSEYRKTIAPILAEATELVPLVTGEVIRGMPREVDERISELIALEENALTPVAIATFAIGRQAKGVVITYPDTKPEHARARRREICLLAATIVAETAVNFGAFSVGSAMGLVGGAAQALSVAAANVVGAFGVGYVARKLHSCDPKVSQYASYGVLGLGIVSLGGYHLTIAAWRDLLARTIHPEGAGQRVFRFLAEAGPAGIVDIRSWLLAGVGMAFAVWALFAGWRFIDVCAKAMAGRTLAAAAKAQAALTAKKGMLLGTAGSTHDDARAHIDALAGDARDALAELYTLVKVLQAAGADLTAELRRINDAYVLAIAKYRTTNMRVRNANVPGYFADPPEPLPIGNPFDEKIAKLAEIAGDGIKPLEVIDQRVREARIALDLARPRHRAAVQALIDRIDHLASGNGTPPPIPPAALRLTPPCAS